MFELFLIIEQVTYWHPNRNQGRYPLKMNCTHNMIQHHVRKKMRYKNKACTSIPT